MRDVHVYNSISCEELVHEAKTGYFFHACISVHCFVHLSPSDNVQDEPVENGMNNGTNGVSDKQPQENGATDHDEQEKPVKPEKVAKKIRVTYEEYRTIANLLILHLRQLEEASEEG